jgi:AcrB/AcrD/AcrF family
MLRCLRIPGCCTRSRVEYGGTHAGRQRSFPGLVLVVLLAVVLVLLFDFLNRSVPIAALASVVLSRSEVVLAVPVARTIFKICSLTGLILVLGIAAENGILPLDPEQRFRSRGFAPGKDMVQGWNRKKEGGSGGREGLAMVAGTLSLGEPAPMCCNPGPAPQSTGF